MLVPTSGYIKPDEMRAYYFSNEDGEDDEDYSFMGFGIISRPQPNGIRDDNQNGYFQGITLKYNDGGGSAGFERVNSLELSDAKSEFYSQNSSPLTSWSSPVTTDNKTNGQKVTTSQSGIDLNLDSGVFNSYATHIGEGSVRSIDALLFNRFADNSNTNRFEMTGNHKVTPSPFEWTPFDENESASAYVMKEIAINNTLAVNMRTKEYRTYPIIRTEGRTI